MTKKRKSNSKNSKSPKKTKIIIELREHWDIDCLKQIIQLESISKQQRYGLKWVLSHLDENNYLTVPYGQNDEVGRLWVKCPTAAQSVQSTIRRLCMGEHDYDFDMVCAAPTIFVNICKVNNIPCPKWNDYINHREETLQKIIEMNDKNINRKQAKEAMNAVLFLCGDNELREQGFNDATIELFKPYRYEAQQVYQNIWQNNNIQPKIKREGDLSSFGARMIYDMENIILCQLREFCVERKCQVTALVFDGLQIAKKSTTKRKLEQMMHDFSTFIKGKMMFDVKFALKDMSPTSEDLEFLNAPCIELSEPKLDWYFDDYDQVSKQNYDTLEEFDDILCTYFKKTVVFIDGHGNGKFIIKSRMYPSQIRYQELDNLPFDKANNFILEVPPPIHSHSVPKGYKYENKKWQVNFRERLLALQEQRLLKTFSYVYFVPYLHEQDLVNFKGYNNNIFNLFPGYPHQLQETDDNDDSNDILKQWQDIYLGHMKNVICNGNEEYFNYLQNFIAHMIQKPYEKAEMALILMGNQGCGKDLFLSHIRDLIGSSLYLETEVNRIAAQFNGSLENKLMIYCTEASKHNDTGILKTIITQDRLMFEPKHKETREGYCFARVVFSSNEFWPVNIESGDRRFVLLGCNNDKINDSQYFTRLANCINDVNCLKAAFQYFATLDITNFHPRSGKKLKDVTNKKSNMILWRQDAKPLRFLGELCLGEFNICYYIKDKNKIQEDHTSKKGWKCLCNFTCDEQKEMLFEATTLFDKYKEWIDSINDKHKLNADKFAGLLKNYSITRLRPQNGPLIDRKRYFKFSVRQIEAALQTITNQRDKSLEDILSG